MLFRQGVTTHRAKDHIKIVSTEILSPKRMVEVTMATNLRNNEADLKLPLV